LNLGFHRPAPACAARRRKQQIQSNWTIKRLSNGGALPLPLRERVGMRGYGLTIDRNPSPGSHLTMRSDLSRKGRGEAGWRAARGFARRAFPIEFSNSKSRIRVRVPAAQRARVVHEPSPKKSEGVGNAGCPLHPQPRVQKVESTRVSTADTPEHPAFPHAMVLTVSFVLSQVTGLVCHLRRRNEAPLKCPVGQEAPSAALTPASGRQDHTTSPSASHIIRPRAV
jgi:hypothetical protein